jgi:inhibitor of KinA sporulation pathway (predicted exonuclease)
VFASCGDFDGNQMKRESQYKNFPVPSYLKRWINLKKVFNLGIANEAFNSPAYIKKCKPVSGGMTDMLTACKLELIGKHHSGIDDARNLARCVLAMVKEGFVFSQGMVHVAGY